MHMGNARGGALGDCLAAVLDWSGCDVTREFYINDAGNQIQKFGKSLAVRYLQKYCGEEAYPLPAECYQGDGTVTPKYFHLPDYVCAPVQQGDVVGTVELKLAGETIGMVNLIAGQDVSRSSLLYSFSKLQEFFGSLYLKVVLVVSAICAIIYVAWVLLNSPHTRHSSKKVHRYGRPRD